MVEVKSIEELSQIKLFDLIREVFDKAYANGDLVYKEPTNIEHFKDPESQLQYEISILEGLDKRPNNRAREPGEEEDVTKEVIEKVQTKDPFATPEPELTVIDSLLDDYRLILNKYPNTKYHFLLVTKDFEKQDSLLKPIELQIIRTILENLNGSGDGVKYFSFFNSGSESGYSQFHKHVQFLKLPEHFMPFQDNIISGVNYFLPKEIVQERRPLFAKKARFKHYILKLKEYNEGEVDREEELDSLAMLYMYLIKRSLNINKEFEIDKRDFSYNLMMMNDWMMIVPRRSAKYEDIWQNSLGFMGLFFLKDEDLKGKVQQVGISKILEECGFPMEEDEHQIVYNEYGY